MEGKILKEKLTERFKVEGSPTRAETNIGYRVEARIVEGAYFNSPLPLQDGTFITDQWTELNLHAFETPDHLKGLALGGAMDNPLTSILPANDLLTFESAQACAWMFLSHASSKFRLECRLVQYKATVHTWIERKGVVDMPLRVAVLDSPRLKEEPQPAGGTTR